MPSISKQNNEDVKTQYTFYFYVVALILLKKNCVRCSSCYLTPTKFKFRRPVGDVG